MEQTKKTIQEKDEATARAKAAFEHIREMAEAGLIPELTLEEINEEIREARRLRKERVAKEQRK